MRLLAVLSIALLLGAGCTTPAEPEFEATIRWTDFGIPHIKANDWGSLGFGYGYAGAKDYLCTIAEEYVTVAGQRSLYFGADGRHGWTSNGQSYSNRESDLFFTLLQEYPDLVDSVVDWPRAETRALQHGYVAGYNRFLADTPESALPADCRGAEWLRPITIDDVRNRFDKLLLIASGYYFAPYMVGAEPPLPSLTGVVAGEPSAADQAATAAGLAAVMPTSENLGLGSNGYAFGGDMTANGRGMLLGNPHFPWEGPERFHMFHVTIPGVVDSMGASLLGIPLPLIGFNDAVAWTHTVSTGWRFSLHELSLAPGDPTSYMIDGEIESMETREVTIETPDGPVSHTFYFSRFGPIVEVPVAGLAGQDVGLLWTPGKAYALQDANARNNRTVETFFRWNTANSFDEFEAALLDTHGIPWVNTIAASPGGDAFYADVSIVPNYTNGRIEQCNTPVGRGLLAAIRLPVFDGSRSECDWLQGDFGGAFAPETMPRVKTRDWLINSNDSYWLPNPDHPITGHSWMIGDEETERSGRTRMGYVLADERLAGVWGCDIDAAVPCDKMTLGRLQESLFSNRLFYPEQADVVDAILSQVCPVPMALASSGAVLDLTAACDALAKWDLRAESESRGVALFELFWERAPRTWGIPFDPADPVDTPANYMAADPRVRTALADAVQLLAGAGIAPDASVAETRFVERGGVAIPIPGAHSNVGSPSYISFPFEPGRGFGDPIHGNSYMQAVTWDDRGPVARALVSYSQSPHEDSPHRADHTKLYSQGWWVDLPFHEADVAARTVETLRLRQG